MSARLLNGTEIARQVRADLTQRVAAVTAKLGRPPGLGIVLVGSDPGSEIYVRNKGKAATELGIRADTQWLPEAARLDEVLAIVERLNQSAEYDGILVQSPLPAAMGSDAEQRVFDTISPAKDVDGFHPTNVGLLVQNRPYLVPCTPLGIIELLARSETKIAGARAVVIGRSDIVGKPAALLPAVAATADILVAAIGRAGFVTRDFVKPGATVVDVGINRVTDPAVAARVLSASPDRLADFGRKGSVLVGDVHPEVAQVAGVMTPVPGGVGPLTIAMLLSNTVKAAEASLVSS
jgi:methylenetetrahydrofolate dehydrogenase (NADP+)/methenyltetrahydrofolate cyclohydrolase